MFLTDNAECNSTKLYKKTKEFDLLIANLCQSRKHLTENAFALLDGYNETE